MSELQVTQQILTQTKNELTRLKIMEKFYLRQKFVGNDTRGILKMTHDQITVAEALTSFLEECEHNLCLKEVL